MADVAELPAAFGPASRRLEEIAARVAETADPPVWDGSPSDDQADEATEPPTPEPLSEQADQDIAPRGVQPPPSADFRTDIGEALKQLEADLAQRAAELAEQKSEIALAARHEFQDNVRRLFDVEP
jgi:hypothetical protein